MKSGGRMRPRPPEQQPRPVSRDPATGAVSNTSLVNINVSGIRSYIHKRATAAKLAVHLVPGNLSAHRDIRRRDPPAAGMSADIVAAGPGQGDVGPAGVGTRLDG